MKSKSTNSIWSMINRGIKGLSDKEGPSLSTPSPKEDTMTGSTTKLEYTGKTRDQLIKDMEMRMDIFTKYLTKSSAQWRSAEAQGRTDDAESWRNRFHVAKKQVDNYSFLTNCLKKDIKNMDIDPEELLILKSAVLKDEKFEFGKSHDGLKGGIGLLQYVTYSIIDFLIENGASNSKVIKAKRIMKEAGGLIPQLKGYKAKSYKYEWIIVPA